MYRLEIKWEFGEVDKMCFENQDKAVSEYFNVVSKGHKANLYCNGELFIGRDKKW